MMEFHDGGAPHRIRWLPPLVLLVNTAMVGLLIIYTLIGLKWLIRN